MTSRNQPETTPTRYRWQPIDPIPAGFPYDFSEINVLQRQWLNVRQARERLDPAAYNGFLERLTRSWAIETGIIEGLYTLDRGMTETLVMHGISADLIDRSDTNKEPEELVRILADHQDAVAGVYAYIREGRPITRIIIQQIHAILTRNQLTYRAFNPSAGWFDARLEPGVFKKRLNNPTRPDGEIHEYCPPEQVESELDNLIGWYDRYLRNNDQYHPLLTAAWIHHRFTQIHPFPDGNGRVVRTILAWHLVREEYLPVVVKRDDRVDYIDALEKADNGDLAPLVDLLVRLERRVIIEALGEPDFAGPVGAFEQVLDHIIEQVEHRNAEREDQLRLVNLAGAALQEGVAALLTERASQIASRLGQAGRAVDCQVITGGPGDKEHWYRRQIEETAKNARHWANFNEVRFFVRLTLTPSSDARSPQLVFVVSLHHTGRQLTGIMAATAFALIEHRANDNSDQIDQIEEGETSSFMDCTVEPFKFTWESDADDLLLRLEAWTDQCLTIALRHWSGYLN